MQDKSSGHKILLKWSEYSSFALFDKCDRLDRLDRSHQAPGRSCEDFHTTATPLVLNPIRINIESRPPRRVQPAQPTGTQGEEGFVHGIGVPPPSVGRPGASGVLETQQPSCDYHSTTMVRVPGSIGDSGYHRESLREDATVKAEPGMEVSAEEGSPQTQENKGSLDHQCFGRGRDGKKPKEEDRSLDLEEKPLPSPGLFGDPCGSRYKPRSEDEKISVNTERNLSKTALKPKKNNSKASRVKMKALGSDQYNIDTKPAGEEKELDGWQLDRVFIIEHLRFYY